VNAVLLDSDVLIEILRGQDAGLLKRWEALAASDVLIVYSPVTAAEIWHGVRDGEKDTVAGLFAALTCLPIDAETGRMAGDYLRCFHRSHKVELGDALIAAAAALHTVPLWTRNRKHYPMKDVRLY
jgi:predicted nucleic acid-binding protein